MGEVALARANRLVRTLEPGRRLAMCAVEGSTATLEGKLQVRGLELRDANAYVNQRHRHLDGIMDHKFSLGAFTGRLLVGVANAGRPVAQMLDNGQTVEILRVATDGTRNACSKLYGPVRREAKRRRIKRIVTYTLP